MRRMLQANNCNAFAAWQVIRDEQKKITPPMKPLPAPHIGVYFSMLDAIQMTAQRILIQQDESTTVPEGNLSLEIKFGFDGSSSHAIYNQINNASTNNMIMTMFCPLKMTDSSSKIIFQQPLLIPVCLSGHCVCRWVKKALIRYSPWTRSTQRLTP